MKFSSCLPTNLLHQGRTRWHEVKDERPHVGNCVLNCGTPANYPYLSHVVGIYPSHPETSMINIGNLARADLLGGLSMNGNHLWKAWNQNIETINSINIMQYAYIGIEYRYWMILNIWHYDKQLQTVQISIRIPIRLPRFGSRQLVKLPPWLDKKAANLATVGHDFTLVTPHLWEILWEDDLNWFDSILIWWLSIHDLLLSISCSSASF